MIGEFLTRDFDVTIMHPRDSEAAEEQVDAIIIRNTWNEKNYGEPEPWYDRWRNKPWLPIHDDLYVRQGEYKDYLLQLYQQGYPVIPSVDAIRNVSQLPETDFYFIKPKDGFDAIGARKLSRDELLSLNPEHFLIQPFVDFQHELSFYYLDKELQHALYAPDKTKRWDLVPFEPSTADIAFAKKFNDWDPQRYGIVRIDACRLTNGELLLVEVTDQGGAYLSVPELPGDLRERFLEHLSASLKKTITRKPRKV